MLEQLATWTTGFISTMGYLGIFITMTVQSALIPIPSEVVMPFSGFLVASGRFSLWGVVLIGTLGNLVGSWLAYAFGYWGHEKVVRKFIRKWGKWILISEHELDTVEHWFEQKGEIIVFVSRLLPGVRTIISLPAGIARMNFLSFTNYTIIGSFIWSYLLALIGKVLGENWHTIGKYFHGLDAIIIIAGVGLIAFYIYHKLKPRPAENKTE